MEKSRRSIVKIKYGSHLYGTDTPESDLDIKGIYLPSERDILLQCVEPQISFVRSKNHGEKNTADDTDYEAFSLARYLELLTQGQTVALDMLFAPDWAIMEQPDPLWIKIKELAPDVITKGATAFVRYCRQQANKYGIKGSRIAAARIALDTLNKARNTYGAGTPLNTIQSELIHISAGNNFIHMLEAIEPNGNSVTYFEVCGKKALMNGSIGVAHDIFDRIVNEYGQRALAAERSEGVDWKALSHAVRVGHQALELFGTGHITFPRPERQHLLSIKQGKLSYQKVAEEIEKLLEDVEKAEAFSTFPYSVDRAIIDDFVINAYRTQIETYVS